MNTNTCAPVGEVFVVVATTSTRPSWFRSAAARPRTSGVWPPLRTDAGQPFFSRSRPCRNWYAATLPVPPTTMSGTPSPSRSVTTEGAYTRPLVAVRRASWWPLASNTNVE